MGKTRAARGPDVGAVPDARPVSKAAWEATKRKLLAQAKTVRAWKPGRTYACPVCDAKAFEGRDDLTMQFVRKDKVFVFGHLHGARCRACNAQTVEAYELTSIEDETGVGLRPDYEAKVSRIGSGSLGTYWPRDLERLLGLRPDKRVFMEVLGSDAVLVRFRDPA